MADPLRDRTCLGARRCHSITAHYANTCLRSHRGAYKYGAWRLDMDFSELQPRRSSAGLAHPVWSGVAAIDAKLSSTATARILAALPHPPRDLELFRQKLATIARRFQRSLRQ